MRRFLPSFKHVWLRTTPHLPLYQQKDIFGVNERISWDAVTGGYVILRTIAPA